jgi:hypothetical protein
MASASLGTNNALFEPIHGSASKEGMNWHACSIFHYDGVEVAIGYGV